MEKKQDARVRYTKMMIRSSFIELLREKPVAKISVTELCERAGINRATFYAHYADPSDLLRSIEDEILNDLSRWLGPAIAAPDGADLAGMLTPIIEYIGENADVCSVLLSSSGDAGFQAKVVDAVEQPFLDYVLPLIQGEPERPLEGSLPKFAKLKKVLTTDQK